MNRTTRPRGYQGGYLLGLIVLVVVAIRTILFYQGEPNLVPVLLLLMAFGLLYISEPCLLSHFSGYKFIYFPLQTVLVSVFCYLDPLLDMKTVLFVPLFIQAFRTFSRRVLVFLTIYYLTLIAAFILFFAGKHVYDLLHRQFTLKEELVERNNLALALSVGGYLVGLTLRTSTAIA